jgi:ABC-type dipeptide/oligopeptide/nickel transport system ATPase component
LASAQITDIDRVMRAFPHELSGGLRQRAMIAAAIVNEPRLLIADEPTTALDALTEREVLSLINNLRAQYGLTVLFVTHDLPLAMKYSDRIFVFKKGNVEEKLEKPFFEPKTQYARQLFRATLDKTNPKAMIEL